MLDSRADHVTTSPMAGHNKSPTQFLGNKFDLVTDFDQTQYKEIAALV